MNNSVDPTTIGAFVTIILAFLGVAKIMLSGSSKEREADRTERLRLADAIKEMANGNVMIADTNKEIAVAVTRQADESAERNGHIAKLIIDSKKEIIKSTTHIGKQEIDNSVVNKQVIKE